MLCSKVGGREFDHRTRTDEEHLCVAQVSEDTLRETDGGGGHRYRGSADGGLAAHLLGYRKRTLEQLVQVRAQCTRLLRLACCVLHLTQNLRLTQHHGIKAACHAKRMPHRLCLRQRVEMRAQVLTG